MIKIALLGVLIVNTYAGALAEQGRTDATRAPAAYDESLRAPIPGVRRRIRRALALHSSVRLKALVQPCFARWTARQSDSRQERADWLRRLERASATLHLTSR